MPDVVKHGWTHRPREDGGTDPIDELPWACAYNQDVGGQAVTATAELEFSNCIGRGLYQVGDPDPAGTFSVDPDDPFGILISRRGLYMCHADVHYDGADAAVARSMYLAWNYAASGPLASVGSELNPAIGLQSASTSIAQVTTIAKTTLQYWAIVPLTFSVSVTNPFRLAVTLQYNSAAYDISSSIVSFCTVVRLSGRNNEFIDFTP